MVCKKISLPGGKNWEEIVMLHGCKNTDLVLKLPQEIRQDLPVKEVFYDQNFFVCLFAKK